MDVDAYYAYSKPTEKRQKRKRRPLPDIPESERKRNIGVMTQTDLYEDWDIFYENCTTGNSGSMCKSSTKPTISIFDQRNSFKLEKLVCHRLSKKCFRFLIYFLMIIIAVGSVVFVLLYLFGYLATTQINNVTGNKQMKATVADRIPTYSYINEPTDNDKLINNPTTLFTQHQVNKENNDSRLATTDTSSEPTPFTYQASPKQSLRKKLKKKRNRKKNLKKKKQNQRKNKPTKKQNQTNSSSSEARKFKPHLTSNVDDENYNRKNKSSKSNKTRSSHLRRNRIANKRRHHNRKKVKTDSNLVYNGRSLSMSNFRFNEDDDGSSNNDNVSDDDEDFLQDDDNTVVYDPKTRSSSPMCSKVRDSLCSKIIPYTFSFPHDSSKQSLFFLTSQVTNRLQRDLVEFENKGGSSFLGHCDAESARLFLCATRYPKCEKDGSFSLPCASWCMEVLTSCLSKTSLMMLYNLRHHNNAVFAKSRSDNSNILRESSMKHLMDVTALVGWSCQTLVDNGVTTSQSKCLDQSTLNSYNNKKVSSKKLQQSDRASCAANNGFLCLKDRCIDRNWVCDGNNDCGEWEDEQNCICSYDEFQCSSSQCIKQKQVCDGFFDCLDKSDETNCESCKGNLTSCGNKQCIYSAWWCDGDVDCQNGNDEINCSCEVKGLMTCDGTKCVRLSARCDGRQDCHDNSDEEDCDINAATRCPPWTMTCDHSCISVTKRCDGIMDCVNGDDERNCECQSLQLEVCSTLSYNVTMLPNFLGHETQSQISMTSEYLSLTILIRTRCHPMLEELGCSILAPPVPLGRGVCQETNRINRRHRVLPCQSLCNEMKKSCQAALASAPMAWPSFLSCNNFPRKENNSVDSCLDVDILNEGMCSVDEFRCVNKNSNRLQCITMASRCDGKEQCLDGSDEDGCDCLMLRRFQCKSGRCISWEWVCDSHRDCMDGSDEIGCSNCSSQQQSCQDYSCVDRDRWCDGNDDCPDGSDEINCLSLMPRGLLRSSGSLLPPNGSSMHNVGVLVGYDFASSLWLPICAHIWNALLSHLACNQMGLRDAFSFKALKYFVPKNQVMENYPITIVKNRRIRRVQELFSHRNKKCKRSRLVHLKCRPKVCGRQNDPEEGSEMYTRIMGGRTSRDRKWSWLVSLQLQGMNHVCGATMVGPRWVVSAAHCFQERNDVSIWKVKIPTHSFSYNVSKIFLHPRYDSQAVDFDIALVRLERFSHGNNPHSLCLPTSTFSPGAFCVIAGWGLTGKSLRGAHKLQEGFVHIIDRVRCQQFYPNHFISNRMMCAGLEGMIDACSGDSGGPLMCWQPQQLQWQLAGITSWGSSCTPNSAPGVYTDVRYFASWMKTIMEFG